MTSTLSCRLSTVDCGLHLPHALLNPRPLRPAHGLAFDGRMPQASQLTHILTDLQHRICNVIGVLTIAQEDVVRQPHRLFVSGSLGNRAVESGFQVNGLWSPP